MPGVQRRQDLAVLDLREVLVELPDRPEHLWPEQAHDAVAERPDLHECLRSGHRHRRDQLRRSLRAGAPQRGDHRRARRQAVVHHDHRPPRDARAPSRPAEEPRAPHDLAELRAPLALDVRGVGHCHHGRAVVQVELPALRHRADRELRLPWRAHLARKHDVELGAQPIGDRCRHRDPAARDRQHQRVAHRDPAQRGSQAMACVRAVRERGAAHRTASRRAATCAANQSRASIAASSSVPGSSKRCDAPETTASSFSQWSMRSAWRFSESTS